MKKIFLLLALLFPLSLTAQTTTPSLVEEISKHYTALPSVYKFDTASQEKISDKISRRYIMGSKSMLVEWDLKKGAFIPMHFHPNEQITWITKGSVKVISQGKEFIVKAGEVIIFPPYVPHEFYALEDTIDIDIFAPPREDWLNDSADYLD